MLKLEITLNNECQALLENRAKFDKTVTPDGNGGEIHAPRFTVAQIVQNALYNSLGLQAAVGTDPETANLEKQKADLELAINNRKMSVVAVESSVA